MAGRKGVVTLLLASMTMIGCGAATVAHGAGYAVFTQGASALGQGNAVTAHTESPSTIFYNPALMNKLEGTQLEAGTTLIYSTHEFHGLTTSSNDSIFFPSTFYATHKFNNELSVGLGVFNPFGLGTEWNDNWQGRFLATKSYLTTYNFNPVISYRVLPNLSIAAGLDAILLNATLRHQTIIGEAEADEKFKGDGHGFGYNVAMALDLTKRLTLGASYRSEVWVDVDGDVRIAGLKVANGNSTVKLPAQLTAGLAYQVSEPLVVELGLRWEQWSSFKNLTIESNGVPISFSQRNWHDTLGANVGGKYKLNETVALSGGYIYGANAVPNYTFEPAIPDSDTHIFCVGTDLTFDRFKVDLAYAYQYYTERKKNNTYGFPALVDPSGYAYANGKYQSDAHLFALSLGYKF